MTQAEIKTWVNAGGDNVNVTLSISKPINISQVKGDVNGDGKVNAADVTALINIIMGKES